MFLIGAIQNLFYFLRDCLGEVSRKRTNKPSFVSFRVMLSGGNKSFIQNKQKQTKSTNWAMRPTFEMVLCYKAYFSKAKIIKSKCFLLFNAKLCSLLIYKLSLKLNYVKVFITISVSVNESFCFTFYKNTKAMIYT